MNIQFQKSSHVDEEGSNNNLYIANDDESLSTLYSITHKCNYVNKKLSKSYHHPQPKYFQEYSPNPKNH